jgi:hypothetical protein
MTLSAKPLQTDTHDSFAEADPISAKIDKPIIKTWDDLKAHLKAAADRLESIRNNRKLSVTPQKKCGCQTTFSAQVIRVYKSKVNIYHSKSGNKSWAE